MVTFIRPPLTPALSPRRGEREKYRGSLLPFSLSPNGGEGQGEGELNLCSISFQIRQRIYKPLHFGGPGHDRRNLSGLVFVH